MVLSKVWATSLTPLAASLTETAAWLTAVIFTAQSAAELVATGTSTLAPRLSSSAMVTLRPATAEPRAGEVPLSLATNALVPIAGELLRPLTSRLTLRGGETSFPIVGAALETAGEPAGALLTDTLIRARVGSLSSCLLQGASSACCGCVLCNDLRASRGEGSCDGGSWEQLLQAEKKLGLSDMQGEVSRPAH